MTRRTAITTAVATVAAIAAHVACTSWLGARDPIVLATTQHTVALVAAMVVLFVSRVALLVLPGLWLWLFVRSRLGPAS